MKNIHNIISNLNRQKNFAKLNSAIIINKLIIALPYNLRKSIIFGHIKNGVLFLATSHSTTSSEINKYKKDLILNLIAQLQSIVDDEAFKTIYDIKAYIPKHIINQRKDMESSIVCIYKERANGEFEVVENKFSKYFNAIKKTIKDTQ